MDQDKNFPIFAKIASAALLFCFLKFRHKQKTQNACQNACQCTGGPTVTGLTNPLTEDLDCANFNLLNVNQFKSDGSILVDGGQNQTSASSVTMQVAGGISKINLGGNGSFQGNMELDTNGVLQMGDLTTGTLSNITINPGSTIDINNSTFGSIAMDNDNVIIKKTNAGVDIAKITLNNGSSDGGELILQSQGKTEINITNPSTDEKLMSLGFADELTGDMYMYLTGVPTFTGSASLNNWLKIKLGNEYIYIPYSTTLPV